VPELVELVASILRADLRLSQSYVYRDEAPLACPITVVAGERDPSLSRESVLAWERESSGPFEARILPGRSHFFLDEEHALLSDLVVRALAAR
jgi:surfactin synthase thioesterase subunit